VRWGGEVRMCGGEVRWGGPGPLLRERERDWVGSVDCCECASGSPPTIYYRIYNPPILPTLNLSVRHVITILLLKSTLILSC